MAEIALIYGSSLGNTERVAQRVPARIERAVDIIDAASIDSATRLQPYRVLLFFASTWGDGELQLDMELLLTRVPLHLAGRHYAVCELGNYYGYDDFEFGALRVLQHFLSRSGGTELLPPFCMDSLPRKDLEGFERWLTLLQCRLEGLT